MNQSFSEPRLKKVDEYLLSLEKNRKSVERFREMPRGG
jgi:hypothetical protein